MQHRIKDIFSPKSIHGKKISLMCAYKIRTIILLTCTCYHANFNTSVIIIKASMHSSSFMFGGEFVTIKS